MSTSTGASGLSKQKHPDPTDTDPLYYFLKIVCKVSSECRNPSDIHRPVDTWQFAKYFKTSVCVKLRSQGFSVSRFAYLVKQVLSSKFEVCVANIWTGLYLLGLLNCTPVNIPGNLVLET